MSYNSLCKKKELSYNETRVYVAWVGSDASEPLLCVAAQDLHAQGDVIDPSQRMDADVAAEERRVKDSESFLVWIIVCWEDLSTEIEKRKKSGRGG